MAKLNEYFQPQSLSVALELFGDSNRILRPLAGGTDLVPAMSKGEIKADGLVDLSKIPEIRGISIDGNEVKIGSTTTFTRIETSPIIRAKALLLSEAASLVGSPQIRNSGTVGGNIANASPAADTVTALVTLDAVATVESINGSRRVLVSDLLCGVGKTNIQPQEIITHITFKIPPIGSKTGFIKLGRRKALAIARMNLAIIITVDDGEISFARVGLGAVGPNPRRFTVLEDSLLGQTPSESLVDRFACEAEREVTNVLGSRASAGYKCEAVKGLARDLLSRLISESRQGVV
ncbi:xanthine dehydrogenase family protein subunit M [Desulfosporosinus fructosivorans]|uniref:Xanthine dehydrogenase family protein subunit M n=1 Tax=Desulfosporosinus fructosivorans TaxID=2018669 RepID=A0A4Z0R4T0_9FIRM|nr:xanthine dehydrogenase family protein subunit M [Desulfosporosinus fructosivorans]TGE38052.1 xanthine dehydrogenase family protein subunit M [Desulfosporosinus fructosivorans]